MIVERPKFTIYLWLTLALAANEGLSFLGYIHPAIGTALFIAMVIGAGLASFRSLETGLLILFTELFVGGKGYLYSLEIDSTRISIRMAFFVIVMLAWAFRFARHRDLRPRLASGLRPWLWAFAVVVVLGVFVGLIKGHGLKAVFFDANAYFFFALALVLLSTAINLQRLFSNLIVLIAAAATLIGLKSLIALGLFVELQVNSLRTLYTWIRNTGSGEVAPIFGGTYRVFFQSQVYGLLGVSLLAPFLVPKIIREKKPWWLLLPITLGVTAVIVSLSRSFWLGGAAAFFIALIIGIRWFRWRMGDVVRIGSVSMAVIGVALTLNSWALNFPYPFPPPGQEGKTNIISQRLSEFGSEAAATSRITLARALLPVIAQSPIIGYGFGKTVTYQSDDPRQVQSPTQGRFTTYAFELGYLDVALKVGLLGLLVLLGVLFQTLRVLIARPSLVNFGLAVGLVTLATVHVTTPYLNHPLGIGFLLLALAAANQPEPNAP